jgi:catechol 2,3-dioxygenase-like lactoylglutathione lyase family enzyme
VIGHLGINVPDLAEARAYYDGIMPLLGFEPFFATDNEIAFMPGGGKRGTYLFIYPAFEGGDYSRHRTGLQHVAFMVPTPIGCASDSRPCRQPRDRCRA